MICNEIVGVVFTLTTGVTGLGQPQSKKFDWDSDDLSDGVRRASVRNVRPGPALVVRDGVGMAYMGRPFASYLLHLTKPRERNCVDPLRSQ